MLFFFALLVHIMAGGCTNRPIKRFEDGMVKEIKVKDKIPPSMLTDRHTSALPGSHVG